MGRCSSWKKADNPEATERKRLKSLAFSNNILSSDSPAIPSSPLRPSKTLEKHHGRDILKKSHRKNRFLFSFPGLLAPLSGGKIGDLKGLGTKNPILYLHFPMGQLKLFGTIVYPKTRYLTLLFSKGGKNVTCEDYFDNMIVFSDAWWIGRTEENPEEARLDFPQELYEGQYPPSDFKGGAGATSLTKSIVCKTAKELVDQSPKFEHDDHFSDGQKIMKDSIVTPVRQSQRTSSKIFNFAGASSGDDFMGSDVIFAREEKKVEMEPNSSSGKHTVGTTKYSSSILIIDDEDDVERDNFSEKIQASSISVTKSKKLSQSAKTLATSKEDSSSSHGPLVQATISTMFKKVEKNAREKSNKSSPSLKVSDQKLLRTDCKRKIFQAEGPRKKGKATKKEKTGVKCAENKESEVEDDVDESSSTSKDTSGSDEDWVA